MPTTRSQTDAMDNKNEAVTSANRQPSSVRGAPSTSRPSATEDSGVRDAASDSRPTAAQYSRDTSAATSSETEYTSSGTTSTENTTTVDSAVTDRTAKPTKDSGRAPRSRRGTSRHSGAEKSKKMKELEAQEKVAALKLEEIRASIALAQIQAKRLRAAATDEEDLASASENEDEKEDEERSSRVQEWLEDQPSNRKEERRPVEADNEERGQGACGRAGGKCGLQDNDGGVCSRVEEKSEHRGMDARPARSTDITSLAAALTQAVKMSRDAPKYLQELPFFNGQPGGWLTFRAAYYETEALFSKTENISRIRRCLKGAAFEAVSCLFLSSPEPQAIVEALERRFGRPDALAMNEIQKMKSLGKLSENARDLCIFANKVSNIVATIEALKKIHYLYNPELVKATIEKLTPILRYKWYDYAAREKQDIPDLKKLAAFLNEEADKCGAYAQPEEISTEKNSKEKSTKKSVENTYSTEVKKTPCPLCEDEHTLPGCKRFREAKHDERWEIVKNKRVCFQCLKGNHRRSACKAKKCGQDGCEMPHHRLLHRKRSERPPPAPKSSENEAEVTSAAEIVKSVGNRNRQAYLKIAPVTLIGPTGARVDTYALLDDGSTVTLLDHSIAETLGLEGPSEPISVQGLNEKSEHENSLRVDVKIKGRYSQGEFTLRNARTIQRIMFLKQNIEKRDLKDCAHLRKIEEQLIYKNACPKLLIGQDNWELLVAQEIITGRRDQPVASNTRLGWVLHGCRSSRQENVAFCGHTVLKEDSEMEKMMKEFSDLEALGVEPRKQKNDPEERALKILKEKSRRLPDGRFETSLLWKQDDFEIPNNYENAFNRLKTLERKLDRDPVLKRKYEERIENLLSSGYAVAAQAPPTKEKIVPEKTGEERCCIGKIEEKPVYLPNIENISKWSTLVRSTARVLQFIDLCRPGKQLFVGAVKRKRTKANEENDPTWKKGRRKEKMKIAPKTYENKRKYVYLSADYVTKAEELWVRAVQQDSYGCERERIISGRSPSAHDKLSNMSVYIENGILRLRGRVGATQEISMATINPAILDGNHRYTRMYIQHVHEKMAHGGVELIVNELRQRYWITRIRPTVKSVLRSCQDCKIRKALPMTPSTGDLPRSRLSHHYRPFSFTGLDYFGPIEVTVGRHREKRWVALFTCLTMRAIHLEVVTSLSADSAISALRRFVSRKGMPIEIWSDNATCFKSADKELKVPAPGHFEEEDGAARKVWRRAQRLADEFWRRWVKEYLPQLQHRREPNHSGVHPKIGDLVIICDPNLPRNVWPRGRVTRVFPGPDGEVRVVDVTTSNGHTLRRPTKRIVVLPVEAQTSCEAGEMCTTE